MTRLIAQLDSSPDLSRPAPSWCLWEAGGHDAVERVLRLVLEEAHRDPHGWFLQAPHADDPGRGAWIRAAEGQLAFPADLDSAALLAGQLHASGNYAIYRRSGGVLPEGLPRDLPWWGLPSWARARERWSAEALVTGLRRAGVSAAMAVHPDANAIVIAVP